VADDHPADPAAAGVAWICGGWLLLFITFMREVSMSLLLSRGGTETLSVALYGLMIYSPIGAMAAFTMVQVALLFGRHSSSCG